MRCDALHVKNDMSNKRIDRSVIIKRKVSSRSRISRENQHLQRGRWVVGISPMMRMFGCVAIHYKVMTMQKAKKGRCTQVYERKRKNVSRTVWTDDDDEMLMLIMLLMI